MRFGRLTILKLFGRDKYQKIKWLARCDCGVEKPTLGRHLISGAVKSCGCLQRENARKCRLGKASGNKLPAGQSMRNRVLSIYKNQAKKRGYEWALSDAQFDTLVCQPCHYCGRPPVGCAKTKANNGAFIYNGLDRMNNDCGYTEGNTVTCCKICNRCKSNMSYMEFIDYLITASHYIKKMGLHESKT